MKYMVDIDNTICISKNSDYANSLPIKKRIKTLNSLYDVGYEIHYWTARGMSSGKDWRDLTIEQFKKWGVKYTSLNFNKPSYDVWIDDKAINSEDFFNDLNNRD
jgi:hypothetical protein